MLDPAVPHPGMPGRCSGCITISGPGTPPRRSCLVFFHQGAPALGEAALRTSRSLQALRAASAAHLSPAGQLQVATALDVLASLEAQLEVLRHELLDAARHLTGAKVLAERLYGVGPATALAMTCWLGGAGAFVGSVLGPGHPCGDDAALLVSELFGNSVTHGCAGAAGETVRSPLLPGPGSYGRGRRAKRAHGTRTVPGRA